MYLYAGIEQSRKDGRWREQGVPLSRTCSRSAATVGRWVEMKVRARGVWVYGEGRGEKVNWKEREGRGQGRLEGRA